MIYIDTEQLQDVMSALKTANENIEEASQYLFQMTTHNNWSCKERTRINEYIQDFRKEIKKIQEGCSSFYDVAKQITDDFIATESGIASLFASVEALLGKTMAINGGEYIAATMIPQTQSVEEILVDNKSIENVEWLASGEWESIQETVECVEFPSDIHNFTGNVSELTNALSVVDFENLAL